MSASLLNDGPSLTNQRYEYESCLLVSFEVLILFPIDMVETNAKTNNSGVPAAVPSPILQTARRRNGIFSGGVLLAFVI
jgi:hypothetical protein